MTDKNIPPGEVRGPRLVTKDTVPPLYDLPQLKRLSDGRLEMLDRRGFVMRPQTSFLDNLRRYYSSETCLAYGRKILDGERILACDSGGVGRPFIEISDAYLDKLRSEFVDVRGVSLRVFKSFMSLYVRFCKFAQDHGWAEGLVGTNHDGKRFRINVPPEGFSKHPVMRGMVISNLTKMPSHRDLELVTSAGIKLAKNKSLKKRFHLIIMILKRLALRRSEGLRLDVWMVPSRKELVRLWQLAAEGKGSWLVPISIERSKRGGNRIAQFPLGMLQELREFIDEHRPAFVKPGVECDAVFLSAKTGARLTPQALTNEFKRATHRAAATNVREFGDMELVTIRPHHCRHRGITDYVRGFLEEGIEPVKAMLMTMDLVGLRSLDVMWGYLHLAKAELDEASPAYKAAASKANDNAVAELVRMGRELRGEYA